MLSKFNVYIWHYVVSLTTFKPISRKYVVTVDFDSSQILPTNYDERLLNAASKGIPLNEEFKHDFHYGQFLDYTTKNKIISQLGRHAINATRILLELSPGIFVSLANWIGYLPEGIFSADELNKNKAYKI